MYSVRCSSKWHLLNQIPNASSNTPLNNSKLTECRLILFKPWVDKCIRHSVFEFERSAWFHARAFVFFFFLLFFLFCFLSNGTPFRKSHKNECRKLPFYAPPPESGGVLCYTLRNFECPSVRPSVRPSVCLSVRPSVRPSVSDHHHSCIGNSSYSFRPILLKLYRCFKDGLKMCILFFQNPEIIFYHFFPIFNLDIFRALILQICIWSMYLVSATPPTVFFFHRRTSITA